MQKKILWRLHMIGADDQELTELCRSWDLRMLVQALMNSYSNLGTVTVNYGPSEDHAHVVMLQPKGNEVTEPREIGYITADKFTLLEQRDNHL